jgi:hypothetical protein
MVHAEAEPKKSNKTITFPGNVLCQNAEAISATGKTG